MGVERYFLVAQGPGSSFHSCPCPFTRISDPTFRSLHGLVSLPRLWPSSLVVSLIQSLTLVTAAYSELFSLSLDNKLSLSEFSLVIPLKWKQCIIGNFYRTEHFARCRKADREQKDDSVQSTGK